MTAHDIRIGRWLVRPALNVLVRGDEQRRVGHKVMMVLVCLAERPGAVVSKDRLVARAWDGDAASDEAVATVVYELRKALDDDARRPRFVETIRKRGYRLIAPVSPAAGSRPRAVSSRPRTRSVLAASLAAGLGVALGLALAAGVWRPPPEDRAAASAAPPQAIHSLLVGPFATFSEACEEDFFAVGLSEMLASDLSHLESVAVVAAGTGGEEDRSLVPPVADAVVDGTVLRSGDRLWLSLQLLDADGRLLWGGSYERMLGDTLDLQQELSFEIAGHIRTYLGAASAVQVAVDQVPASAAAELVRFGHHFLRRGTAEDAGKARHYFTRAVRQEPALASAHAGLAASLLAGADTLRPPARDDAYRQARSAAERALELDAGLPQAHLSLGTVAFRHGWDWPRAERHLELGFAPATCSVDDAQPYARYLSAMGRHDEAVAAMRLGLERDPASLTGRLTMAWVYYLARRYPAALAELETAADLAPDLAPICRLRHDVLLAAGDAEAALEALEDAMRLAGAPASQLEALADAYRENGIHGALGWLRSEALARAAAGDAEPWRLASLAARLGDADEALDWLQRAYAAHDDDLVWLKVEPAFDPLRGEARFRRLLERLDLGS